MKNTPKRDPISIKVSYSYKSTSRSFLISEDSCLYKYFVRHNHIIIQDNKLFREGTSELDEQIKKLAQKNIMMQADYRCNEHPMNIAVWRGDQLVYFIKDYFSENEIQEIITKML